MKIRNWDSASGNVFIIAEIGSNHDGDFERAQRMSVAAIAAGADAVKFQVYDAARLVAPDMAALVPTHATQLERMQSLQLSHDQYRALAQVAHLLGKAWIASAFDQDSVDLVAQIGDAIKVASGELTNEPLLRYIASKGKPVILSTGMASAPEIQRAVHILGKSLAVLHCVSLYPTPFDAVNFEEIVHLRENHCKRGEMS